MVFFQAITSIVSDFRMQLECIIKLQQIYVYARFSASCDRTRVVLRTLCRRGQTEEKDHQEVDESSAGVGCQSPCALLILQRTEMSDVDLRAAPMAYVSLRNCALIRCAEAQLEHSPHDQLIVHSVPTAIVAADVPLSVITIMGPMRQGLHALFS